jgi:hypothetical protein
VRCMCVEAGNRAEVHRGGESECDGRAQDDRLRRGVESEAHEPSPWPRRRWVRWTCKIGGDRGGEERRKSGGRKMAGWPNPVRGS